MLPSLANILHPYPRIVTLTTLGSPAIACNDLTHCSTPVSLKPEGNTVVGGVRSSQDERVLYTFSNGVPKTQAALGNHPFIANPSVGSAPAGKPSFIVNPVAGLGRSGESPAHGEPVSAHGDDVYAITPFRFTLEKTLVKGP